MRRLAIATVLALTLTTALVGAGSAADQRPMSGEFTITLATTTPRCGGDLTLGFVGIGLATHLGRMTGTASNCTEYTLFTQAVPVYDGVAIFTAADGSTITTHYNGTQGAPVGGVAQVESTHTVVDGTGRFADAAGTWTLTGIIDFAAGSSTGDLAGWLSY